MHSAEQEVLRQEIASYVDACGGGRHDLLQILEETRRRQESLSPEAMQAIAERLAISPAEVYSVASFYPTLDAAPRGRYALRLCHGVSCALAGKDDLARHLEQDLGIAFGAATPDGLFSLDWADCLGLCDQGPALKVNDRVYTHVTPALADEILAACRRAAAAVDGPVSADLPQPTLSATPVSPTLDAVAPGAALRAVRAQTRAAIVRGMPLPGGNPFHHAQRPLGARWALAAASADSAKRVICNADAGYPGSFRDRALLSTYLDLVVEGMAISAYIVGAAEAILYLPDTLGDLRATIEGRLSALKVDWLGQSGLACDVRPVVGAGGHVGQQAGALLAALDGDRGEPATTASRGYAHGLSAAIAGPVDFARLAALCAREGAWPVDVDAALAALPALLAVSGDCARPGLYEYAADVTIAEILGTVGAGEARAVQVGGIAAPFTLADAFARPLTAAERAGDGAFIVYGPQRNLLREAREIMALFQTRSCGQCTPCRNGLAVLLANADSLLRRERPAQSNREIISLGETVHLASKCPLGQAAPVAFLSVMERIAAHR